MKRDDRFDFDFRLFMWVVAFIGVAAIAAVIIFLVIPIGQYIGRH